MIDALIVGKVKTGTKILDTSDVMGLLKHPKFPLVLNERYLIDGMTPHIEMTAQAWKRVPEWLENQAAVFKLLDEKNSNRVVLLIPELLAGHPVVMVIDPNPGMVGGKSGQASFERLMVFAKTSGYVSLVNVARQSKLLYLQNETAPANYQSEGVQFPRHSDISTEHSLMLSEMNLTANPPACRANDGLLRYLNYQKATPETRSFQPQLAGLSDDRGRRKILTESAWSVPDLSRQGSEI